MGEVTKVYKREDAVQVRWYDAAEEFGVYKPAVIPEGKHAGEPWYQQFTSNVLPFRFPALVEGRIPPATEQRLRAALSN